MERTIRVSDIQNNSPFNTYHIYGLPPAPICNPGIASIKAVLNPIQSDYLFFVASGKGDHIFSSNIKDHNANVARYRSIMQNKEQQAAKTVAVDPEAAPTAPAPEAATLAPAPAN